MWYKYRFYVEFKSPFPKFRNKSLVRRCVLLVRPVSSRPLSHHSLDLNCFHPCEFVIGYRSQIAHRLQTPNTHKISSVFIDISGWFASTLEDVLSKQLSLWPHPNVLSCYDRTPLTHHISSVFTSIFICLLMKPAQLGFDNFNQFEQWYRITNLGTAPNLFRLQVLIASLLHQDCTDQLRMPSKYFWGLTFSRLRRTYASAPMSYFGQHFTLQGSIILPKILLKVNWFNLADSDSRITYHIPLKSTRSWHASFFDKSLTHSHRNSLSLRTRSSFFLPKSSIINFFQRFRIFDMYLVSWLHQLPSYWCL